MGVTLEGVFDDLAGVVKQCFEAMAADCDRMIDYRKDRQGRLASKIASVEQKLGQPVKQ